MNWLEEAEYYKKQRDERESSLKHEKEINLTIISEKLKKQFTTADRIQKRINDVFRDPSKTLFPDPFKIYGGVHFSDASFSSCEIQITKDISNDYDSRRYNYKKRRISISTECSDLNNCIWSFIEDFYEYTSYRDMDWEYSSWSTYDDKKQEQLLYKKNIQIDEIKNFSEDFWLKLFEWLMFKTNKIYV